jgi:hypothetical protein
MQAFEREVCQRLPLADAVLRLLDFVTADDFLDGVFERHHGRSYEDVLSFPLFTHLIADTLLTRDHASAHQSFLKARAQGTLPTCVEALYGKLRRVPLTLSQGLLAEATQQLRQVFPDASEALPASLQGLDVFVFDGKKLKYVVKRLKPLRLLRGHILGGKLLVVLHAATGLAVALEADADGESGDNPLVAGAVGQVRQHPGTQPRLWIGDRLFCDLQQMPLLAAGGDFFLLRYQSKVGFHLDPLRPARTGTDARGLAYTEDWGWLGAASRPQRQYVRRITLHRPGLSALIVVTNLLDADTYPAADLLEAYWRRWGIELFFRELKSRLQLGGYVLQKFAAVERYLDLVLMGFLLLERERLRAQQAAGPPQPRGGEPWVQARTTDRLRALEVLCQEWNVTVLERRLRTAHGRRCLLQQLRTLPPCQVA